MNYTELLKQVDTNRLPRHIAIIMDGNGRWAKKRGFKHLVGHNQGAIAVRETVEAAVKLKIEHVTVYAFSTENWNRSRIEVQGLLQLIMKTLEKEIAELNENNVKVHFFGSNIGLSKDYLQRIDHLCEITQNNTGLKFNVAFNYGSRAEIIDSVNRIL
ncbi:MAG: di-trans,poly-cis-decaprenylcistransferase, partial [Candidatus Cloacimonetes bacterium]|nr:di-trans,poly-cis-decaprenylcistransferase [Candidatus Cloacimonadota bacterium]